MDQRLLSLFTLFPINNAGAKIRDKLNSATGLITVASLFRYAKGLFMIFVKNFFVNDLQILCEQSAQRYVQGWVPVRQKFEGGICAAESTL